MNKISKFLIFSMMLLILLTPVVTERLLDIKQEEENQRMEQARREAELARLEAERLVREREYKMYLTGRFDPATYKDFVLIPAQHRLGNKMYLRKEAYAAFVDMRKAAAQDGLTLNIASATRNFTYQKNLWENKWNGITLVDGRKLPEGYPDGLSRFQKILEYSAAPGISRHHWGTDIDINNADVAYFETANGKKVYAWLEANAPLFGFCQTYNQKGTRVAGYNEEKWHWSYLPLAKIFTEDYAKLIQESDISGFAGDEYVKYLGLIQNYVLSINPECL